mgnify:CR=1 FL=1
MAIINSKTYRILDARTIINILNSRLVQTTKYPHIRNSYFEIKLASSGKVMILIKSQYASNIGKIFDNVTELFSVDVLLGGKKVSVFGDKSKISGIDYQLTLQQNVKKVEIFFKASKKIMEKVPELLRPGVLNEEYIVSKINDRIEDLQEAKNKVNMPKIFNPVLTLGLFENNKEKYVVGPIKSIKRVGQELEKADVLIETIPNKKVKVSLKKENFSFWSSAEKYEKGKKLLDYLVNQNIIQTSYESGRGVLTETSTGKKIRGIRVPATIEEIKKYCFGEGNKKIDYILIQSFEPGDFTETRTSGRSGEVYKMNLNSNRVYKETTQDILRLRDDVYFCITSSSRSSSGMGSDYPGFKINFMNKKSSKLYFQPNLQGVKV